jgi:ubiquinone/menaquinone biosynthesis C-methylase UbiE
MNGYKENFSEQRDCMQKEFFNQRAQEWDKNTKHDTDKIKYILSQLDLRGSEKILDVGTGTGILIPFYMKYLTSGTITAIDFSEKMIEVASSKFLPETYPQVEFISSDVYDIKYSNHFDIVMCYSCFPHFKDKPRAISIFKKMLKFQGKLVVAHSNSRDEINSVHIQSGYEISKDILPARSVLKNMIQTAGLKVIFERDDKDFFIMIAEKV